VVHFAEHIDLVEEDVGVADEALVDDLDDSVGVGGLLEFGPEDGAVASSADGLNGGRGTFW